ncbi:shikimate dehydrogenase family protein [Aerococcaceae bacterium WGS1372]
MKYVKEINTQSKLAAVIGSPISHSLSPFIYNSNFENQNLNIIYMAFETSEADTVKRIESLKNLDVLGINITMPGKHVALQCCDQIDQVANYVKAINMLVKQNDQWIGYNTDGVGFWNSVKAKNYQIEGSKITLFGSGSTTRIILAQAVIEGASDISIIARNLNRKLEIKKVIERLKADYPQVKINLIDIEDQKIVKQVINQADIIVQTTNVGMKPNEQASLLEDPSWLNAKTLVCDIIYNPRETLIIQQAKEMQCQTLGGIYMLVHQAAINYQLMTGLEMDIQKTLSLIP